MKKILFMVTLVALILSGITVIGTVSPQSTVNCCIDGECYQMSPSDCESYGGYIVRSCGECS